MTVKRIVMLIVVGLTLMSAYQFYGLKSAQASDKDLMYYSALADKFEPIQNAGRITPADSESDPISGPCCNCTCTFSGCTAQMAGRDCSTSSSECNVGECGATVPAG